MIKKTVSVIVPVYDVEKYLPRCIESICNQTYTYLEIIVVDDESPDNSGKIAEDYAKKDSRIKVLHIKNKGAAGARNIGLDAHTGDYVFFVDSDDWIESNTIEIMLKKLISSNADIVQCQYIDEYKSQSINHICDNQVEKYNDEEFIKDMIPHWENILIWNKIYKSHLFDGVRFVEGRCIDDEFLTYKVVSNASNVVIIKDYLYHYINRKSGAMGNPQKKKQRHKDQVDFVTQRYSFLIDNYPNLKSVFLQHMCEVLMLVMRNGCYDEETYSYAKCKLKKYSKQVLKDKEIDRLFKKSIVKYLLRSKKNLQPEKERILSEDCFD